MTTRLIRLTLSAIALAHLAEAQSVAKPPLATQTQQREMETGSWRAGDAIVWVRVAPTGAIAVFASHGYRSAFAHAVYITPEDAERWADIGDHVVAGQPTAPAILADSDLALEPTKQGDSAILTVRLGGVRPDGITFFMPPTAIREVSPILRQTARTARANQAASAGPSAAVPPPAAPVPAAAAAVAPSAAPVVTPAATPAVTPAAAPAAPNTASAAIVAPPEVAAPGTAAASAPSVAEAPTVASPVSTPAPVVPVSTPASVVPVSATTTPSPVASAATCAPSKAAAATPAKVAQVTKTTTPVTNTKPQTPVAASGAMRRTSAGSIAKPAATSATRDDVTDAARLSPSTVANLVKQWQSQLDLCYTEYGLKVNPALTGSIAVRLAIRSSGEVAAATFTRHNWSGAGGTEAESCMRARAMAWMFPPASTPSAHEFTVAFAP